MEKLILPKNKMSEFIKGIQTKYQIFAPVENGDFALYKQIKTLSKSKKPIKNIVIKTR